MARKYLIIFLLCFIAFFAGNSVLPPDIMEARNIVTAREMAYDGNWLVPTMNADLRLEKPPLPTWVAGAIEVIAPDNIGAQRAAAGVMATVWVLFLFLFARRLTGNSDYALIATVIFLTCYQIVTMGRTATWDIYCHSFMMGAIYFLWRGFYDERNRQYLFFTLTGLLLGLSFLSKGPVSFYALLLPFLIAALCTCRPKRLRIGALGIMLLVFLAVSCWWYVYLLAVHYDKVQAAINQESGAWLNHNVRPFYYYWRFFAEMGAWALITLASLLFVYWRKRLVFKKEYTFSIIWLAAVLLCLSLIPEKKIRYLLPVMVPCSLSCAFLWHHFTTLGKQQKFSRLLYKINGCLIGAVVVALPVAVAVSEYLQASLSRADKYIIFILFPLIGIYMLVCTFRLRPKAFLGAVAAVFAVVEVSLINNIGSALYNDDYHSVEQVREVPVLRDVPFYYNAEEELRIETVYMVGKKVLPLNLKDSAAIMQSLPCALFTRDWVCKELPANILQNLDTLHIGDYDNNLRKKGAKTYRQELLNKVTLLKIKERAEAVSPQ